MKEKVLLLANNGIITTSKITKQGIHRSILTKLVNSGDLIQYERGIYMTPDAWEDEFYLIQQKYKRGIISHASALYLLGYSERVPLTFHLTFPNNYHSKSLNWENVIVSRVINNLYDLGIIEITTPLGNVVRAYDLERCLCDIVKGSGDDIQVIQYAMKKYASSKDKDINKLMEYARILRVEPKIRRYMEVLL